jgi:hypothetical protein
MKKTIVSLFLAALAALVIQLFPAPAFAEDDCDTRPTPEEVAACKELMGGVATPTQPVIKRQGSGNGGRRDETPKGFVLSTPWMLGIMGGAFVLSILISTLIAYLFCRKVDRTTVRAYNRLTGALIARTPITRADLGLPPLPPP